MEYEKEELLAKGKTKEIWTVKGFKNLVIIKYKNAITKFDDPSLTKSFSTKGAYSNTTTCQVFELLKKAGIPIAFLKQISPKEFLAANCEMIKLEVIARRFAVGSYLKRHPELKQLEGQPPHRFHRLAIEFFLKTTNGKFIHSNSNTLIEGLDSKKEEEDPFIANPFEKEWQLFHSKKPAWDTESNLKRIINDYQVVGENAYKTINKIENITRKVFLTLEGAWNTMGLHLIDFKIEFGIDPSSGEVVVADVIDNDSWRLQDKNWQELSKEVFREGKKLDEVEQKYGIVADLVKQIRIPKQALVVWTGSDKDKPPKVPSCYGIDVINVVFSGHKATKLCLNKLEEIIGNYPDGGVIVVKVGRSNGLGPVLASHTIWPVIATPATLKESPENLWSSIKMPSLVPLITAWPEKNAIMAALNILAMKNPLLYMQMQEQIETLDI